MKKNIKGLGKVSGGSTYNTKSGGDTYINEANSQLINHNEKYITKTITQTTQKQEQKKTGWINF